MRTSLLCLALLLSACKQEPARPRVPPGPALHEIAVTTKGFEPARIAAAPGQQLTLRFTRKTDETCADAVEVKGDPVRHMLPLNTPIEVKVTAPPSGEIAFTCPMKMVRGKIVVE